MVVPAGSTAYRSPRTFPRDAPTPAAPASGGWTTDELSCSALWAPPERWRTTLREDSALCGGMTHPRLIARLPMTAARTARRGAQASTRATALDLAVLGTDPVAQGRGLGSAVLHPVFERCDADSVGAYLESSKERNIDFYARHGFRVMRELRLHSDRLSGRCGATHRDSSDDQQALRAVARAMRRASTPVGSSDPRERAPALLARIISRNACPACFFVRPSRAPEVRAGPILRCGRRPRQKCGRTSPRACPPSSRAGAWRAVAWTTAGADSFSAYALRRRRR